MRTEFVNTEKKLVSLASSIGRNTHSWEGWSCLCINVSDLEKDHIQDMFLWSRSVLEASLKDTRTDVFFSSALGIHVISKQLRTDVLKELGEQICDITEEENNVRASFEIYDLKKDAEKYVQYVLEKATETPILIMADMLDAQKFVSLLPAEGENSIKSKKDFQANELKVLLIEDDPVTRWMVRNTLKNNCTFLTASCAHKAYDLYNSFKPDIVFLDIGLPDQNGRDVLRWIMHNDPGAYVIMFSSNDNLENISNSLEDGAMGFIPKPFMKDHLLHYLHMYDGVQV